MVRRIMIMLLFLSTSALALTEQDERWLKTLDAVWAVESVRQSNPPDGDGGKAVGPLQIWKVRVNDCNRIIGYRRWTYEDRRNWVKSVEMFRVSCLHYWPNGTMEQWSRHWNGNPVTGPSDPNTLGYWRKVRKEIHEQ